MFAQCNSWAMPRKRAIRSKKYNLAAHRLTSSQAQPLLTTTTKTRTRDISMSLDAIRNFDRSNRPPIHFPWEEIRLDQNPTCKMWFSARFVCHLQRIVEWLPTSRRQRQWEHQVFLRLPYTTNIFNGEIHRPHMSTKSPLWTECNFRRRLPRQHLTYHGYFYMADQMGLIAPPCCKMGFSIVNFKWPDLGHNRWPS